MVASFRMLGTIPCCIGRLMTIACTITLMHEEMNGEAKEELNPRARSCMGSSSSASSPLHYKSHEMKQVEPNLYHG